MRTCSSCSASLPAGASRCEHCGAPTAGNSPRAEAALARASELRGAGRHADAIETLTLLLDDEPSAVDGWFLLADSWQLLRRDDKALEAMRRGAEHAPDSAGIAFNLGVLLADRGDAEEARHHLETCLERLDASPDAALTPAQVEEMRRRAREWLDVLA